MFDKHDKFSPFSSTHYVVLYPQNGDRIVTIDSVAPFQPKTCYHFVHGSRLRTIPIGKPVIPVPVMASFLSDVYLSFNDVQKCTVRRFMVSLCNSKIPTGSHYRDIPHVINNGTCLRKKSRRDGSIRQRPPSLGSSLEMQQKGAEKNLKVTHASSSRFYETYVRPVFDRRPQYTVVAYVYASDARDLI